MWNTVRDLQRAKKVMSSSPRQVDFSVGIVDSVLHLPNRQVKVSCKKIQISELPQEMKSFEV